MSRSPRPTRTARIDAIQGDDLADIMFTSGTTGHPKGAMSTHAQNLRVYEVWSEVVGLREGDRYLIVNPFFHGFGYKAGWFASILRGATIVPMAVFDVPAVMAKVQEERITFLPGPPTLLFGLLEFPDRDQYDLSSLRTTVTGAAVVPVELIKRLRSEMTFETIITGYGLTETSGTVSMCRYDDDPETIANFSGRAIPDTELKVVGPDGEEMPRNEPGEIVTRGYHIMVGYFGDPEETAETIDADGWLHTGDIGIMDERGYSASPTGSRTCTSSAGSTRTRPRSRTCCSATTRSRRPRWSACPTSAWARSGWRSWCRVRARPSTPTR